MMNGARATSCYADDNAEKYGDRLMAVKQSNPALYNVIKEAIKLGEAGRELVYAHPQLEDTPAATLAAWFS